MAESPNDIFDQVHNGSKIEDKGKQVSVTSDSPKLDVGVKSVEDRLITWQERINDWRRKIIKNENIIIMFCVLTGAVFSYAINECTGDFDFPWYAYLMGFAIIALWSLLMITEGGLQLIVLIRFGVTLALGHYSMMWLVAIDGHSWHIFTFEICRYPMTQDLIAGFFVGIGSGFILAKFKIKEAG